MFTRQVNKNIESKHLKHAKNTYLSHIVYLNWDVLNLKEVIILFLISYAKEQCKSHLLITRFPSVGRAA